MREVGQCASRQLVWRSAACPRPPDEGGLFRPKSVMRETGGKSVIIIEKCDITCRADASRPSSPCFYLSFGSLPMVASPHSRRRLCRPARAARCSLGAGDPPPVFTQRKGHPRAHLSSSGAFWSQCARLPPNQVMAGFTKGQPCLTEQNWNTASRIDGNGLDQASLSPIPVIGSIARGTRRLKSVQCAAPWAVH